MMVWGKCLSNTKNFKNKMTHLSSWGKFRSGSVGVAEGLRGSRNTAGLSPRSHAPSWPVTLGRSPVSARSSRVI